MSVTVVVRRRARPGQGEALVAAMTRRLADPTPHAQPRSAAWVFQGVADPDVVLYLAHWDSREAYAARRQGDDPAELDALAVGKTERRFYHPLTTYEAIEGRMGAISCTRLQCRRAATLAVLTFLLEGSGPTIRGYPGVVSHHLYQDEDHPNHFLAILGWESLAVAETARRDIAPGLDAELGKRGAILERFIGRTRAEATRDPLPT